MHPTLKPDHPFDFSHYVGIFFMEGFIYTLNFCPVTLISHHKFFNYHENQLKYTRKKYDLNLTCRRNLLRTKYTIAVAKIGSCGFKVQCTSVF